MRPQRAFMAAAVMESHFYAVVESPSPNCNRGIIAYYRTTDIFVSMRLLRLVLAEQTHVFLSFPLCKWVHLFKRTEKKKCFNTSLCRRKYFCSHPSASFGPVSRQQVPTDPPPPPGSVYPHQSVQCFLAGALCLHMNEPEFLGFC